MEIKTDALVLRTVDYGENDKIITLLTAEYGKIGASCKGVKKAGAKLKFAAQPFCFAEYVLASRSNRYTVTAASLYDGFYPIREDITAFYAATAVCEACDALLYEGMVNPELLVSAITALKGIAEGEIARSLIAFLLRAMELAGYPVNAEECSACGGKIRGKLFFDLASGSFFCEKCAVGTPASESTYHLLRRELGLCYEEERISPDAEKRALRLLSAYYTYQTEGEIASLKEYLRFV